MSSTEYHSKEHSQEVNLKEKHTTEHYTANQGKTDVVIERVQKSPVVVEHHHHHTHTVVHPEVIREHDTTEIRQVVQPIYEHVKAGEKVEYAGKDVKVVEKSEDVEEARLKLEALNRDIQAKADVTHTKEQTMTVDRTKEVDIHKGHRVIEEVTPVIIRDVEHNKTIHKDEKLVEKIHHAPDVVKEEKEIKYKEGHIKDEHHTQLHKEDHAIDTTDLHHKHKEGHSQGMTDLLHKHKEGHSQGTTDLHHKHKEGHSQGMTDLLHKHKEGHSENTTDLLRKHKDLKHKEGHTKDTTGISLKHKEGIPKEKLHKHKEGHSKDKKHKEAHVHKEVLTTDRMTGDKEIHTKDTIAHGLREGRMKDTIE